MELKDCKTIDDLMVYGRKNISDAFWFWRSEELLNAAYDLGALQPKDVPDFEAVRMALVRLTRASEARENWKAQGITHDTAEKECWDAMKQAQGAMRQAFPATAPRDGLREVLEQVKANMIQLRDDEITEVVFLMKTGRLVEDALSAKSPAAPQQDHIADVGKMVPHPQPTAGAAECAKYLAIEFNLPWTEVDEGHVAIRIQQTIDAAVAEKCGALEVEKLRFAACQLRIFAPHQLISKTVERSKLVALAKELETEANALAASTAGETK